MVKKRYEKPEMLVEMFVATQSVVAACGDESLRNQTPLEVSEGEHVCGHPSCGHTGTNKKGGFDTYDKYPKDGKVNVFGVDGGCTELIYGSTDPEKVATSLDDIASKILGNGSWGSTTHPPIIDGVELASF